MSEDHASDEQALDQLLRVFTEVLAEITRIAETSNRVTVELAGRIKETQDVTLALIHDVRGEELAGRIAELYRERWSAARTNLEGIEGVHDLERWLTAHSTGA